MEVVKTIEAVRELMKAVRMDGRKIGFVPTMGALHIGHVSLIEVAVKSCDFVVVSIFVNPTQFGPGEDYEKYPRPLEADLEICQKAKVDAVFVPTAEEMYPDKNITCVNVEKLTEKLCGRSRPGHFRGVTTVCAKLFNIITPDIAFFGQKDAQQSIVIKQMVADLNMSLEIAICPTIRESDGLAVSSRNQYLNKQQRQDAAYLYKSLQKSLEMVHVGKTDTKEIISEMKKILNQKSSIEVEYVNIVNYETLEDINRIVGKVLVAVAVKLGPARLIDNILIDMNK